MVNYAEYRRAHPRLMPWGCKLDLDHMWVAFEVNPPERITFSSGQLRELLEPLLAMPRTPRRSGQFALPTKFY